MNKCREIMITLAGMLLLASSLAGCASTDTDPVRVEDDFGQSVRQMVDAQIYDPEAAQNPPKAPPMGIDGIQAEEVLKTYREHVGDPDEIKDHLRIEVSD